MVVYIQRYNVIPEKRDAWQSWAQVAIPEILKVPGLIDLSAHRPVTGDYEVALLYTFATLDDWSSWINSTTMQRLLVESRQYEADLTFELWNGSALVPNRLPASR